MRGVCLNKPPKPLTEGQVGRGVAARRGGDCGLLAAGATGDEGRSNGRAARGVISTRIWDSKKKAGPSQAPPSLHYELNLSFRIEL
jgi:hypothetical protein